MKTPVVKVSTRTDATARKYTVRRLSDRVPGEALQGLSFPFEVPVKLRLTATRGFRKGLENMVAGDGPKPDWYASDNGFSSEDAMDAAHAPVVGAAVTALAGTGGDVLDLGCGNGALLASGSRPRRRASCRTASTSTRSASSTPGWCCPRTPTTS